jgi:hypothetical protein
MHPLLASFEKLAASLHQGGPLLHVADELTVDSPEVRQQV